MNDLTNGALLGLAVGDALGTTYEFDRIDQPSYPTLATGPADDVVGGGPFGLAPGQVTDDTQLAVCLARSLADCHRLNIDDVARRYVVWAEHAFDIGNQTAAAIRRLRDGVPPDRAGHDVWLASGKRAAGNGSLMRTAPIAVALMTAPAAEVIRAAIADSMITHADPRCALACAAFDLAIATRCAADPRIPVPFSHVARAALQAGAEQLRAAWPDDRTEIDRAEADLSRDLDAADSPDPGVYLPETDLLRTAGFVRVAFRLAFWHVAHTETWRAAVIDVASRGGDADTNAAIVGALVGARDGTRGIPEAWRERVLVATEPGPAEWAEAHHPKYLLMM
ncbi:MAG TPA: ADP-ribosylglycohydrolase family protein [Kofleriaceae bacterium]|nr:ADP-ribosylglycohydrolase family protein [Kofleriaceae bacterium]